jgi:hypothetical protein
LRFDNDFTGSRGKPPESPSRLHVLVRLAAQRPPGPRLAQALETLQCRPLNDGPAQRCETWFDGSRHDALRELVAACRLEGALVLLQAQRPPAVDGEPYQRLWDRTDDYAAQLEAWTLAQGPLPALLPGELIRF